jgi:hypothetical protein
MDGFENEEWVWIPLEILSFKGGDNPMRPATALNKPWSQRNCWTAEMRLSTLLVSLMAEVPMVERGARSLIAPKDDFLCSNSW